MNVSYTTGARGFVVQRLQQVIGVAADGVFGKQTDGAVRRLQGLSGLPATGMAGEKEFLAAGLDWPSEFERAINLVSNFEGTSFGDCNATDIDGAGLTLGIAGFTTQHGEVQELLARYLGTNPAAADALPRPLQQALAEKLSRRASGAEWKQRFYGNDGRVLPAWKSAFSAWGKDPAMRQLQLDMAQKRFWQPAVQVAESLGFASVRARVFMLDVAVQNGGWRKLHHVVAKRMIDWHSGDEQKALVVAARAVAACARERWRNDVLSRKMAIATGSGVVHGRQWDLRAHAL